MFVCLHAAFIPLSDLADPVLMKKYGVKPDPETLEIVTTAAKQREVHKYLL